MTSFLKSAKLTSHIFSNDGMRSLLLFTIVFVMSVVAPPPQRAKQEAQAAQQAAQDAPKDSEGTQNPHPNDDAQNAGQKPMYEFAYSKYLEEVVKILESDPKFTEKLKQMPEADIKAGKIADHIDDLDNHVFDKLHKAKLEEIERLRQQIEKQISADGGAHNVKMPDHLDVNQWEKFGREDLRKLIQTTVQDMDNIDKERREGFKEYELKKKAEEDHKLAMMNEEERKRAAHEAEEAKKRHNEHEKLKHPASRDQLEEVWEDADHMDKDSFEPRTFFALHDLNGDGFWNSDELEALFQIELEKMYNDTNPDDDPRERMEEMYRMREHVTNQMDKNKDRLISVEEFLQDTEAQTPNKDDGWKDLGDQEVYTDEELQKFEEEYAKNMAPQAQPIQPQQVNHGTNNGAVHEQAVPVNVEPAQHQPKMVHAAQPAQPAPVGQQPAQPAATGQQPGVAAGQQPAPAQQVPQAHQPVVDVPKDPTYGI